MDELNNKEHPQSRVKKGSSTFKYIAIVIFIVFAISFYFYVQKPPSSSSINNTGSTDALHKTQLSDQATSQSPSLITTTKDDQTNEKLAQPEEAVPHSNIDNPVDKQPTNPVNSSVEKGAGETNNSASSDAEDNSIQSQQRFITEINAFYTHLDQQPYMQNFGLKESSKVYFSKLFQKLINNPPVVIGETDDLFTLLQNTSHFFRVVGKNNINILKVILDKEQDSFEQILKDFYGLTSQPEYLKKEYSLSLPPNILTNYAAFFLNTMGGRLYLFRRDSTSRMVVNYYAIIIIARANAQGNEKYGIDLRPAIHSLVEEMENGGKRLKFKEQYLDALYDLQEKYN